MTRLRRTLLLVALCGGLLVAGLAALGILGIAVPAGPLRGVVESRVAELLGRPVRLGAVGVVPGLPPAIRVRELVVEPSAVADRSGAGEPLRVSRLTLRLALLPLWRGDVQVHEIRADGIRLELVGEGDAPGGESDADPAAEPWSVPALDLGHLELRNVVLQYRPDPGSDPIELGVELLEGRAPSGESLELLLRGSLGEEPLGIELHGAPLSALGTTASLSPVQAWPFQARASWGELALGAQGSLDRSRGEHCVQMDVEGDSLDVTALARQLRVPGSASGSIEGLEVALAAPCAGRLDPLGALDLEFRIASARAHLADPEGKEIDVDVEHLAIAHAAYSGLQASGELNLAGERLAIALEAGSLAALRRDPWPIHATLEGAGTRLEADGELGPDPRALRLDLESSGERLGDLARWLGFPRDAALPYRVQGQLQSGSDGWRLDLARIELGWSRGRGSLAVAGEKGGAPIAIEIAADRLHVREISKIFKGGPIEVDPGDEPFSVDVPIIPGRLILQDADLELSVARFDESWSKISDLAVAPSIRDGKLRGPVRATIGGLRLEGKARLDPTAEIPRIGFDLTAEDADLGGFLEQFDLAEGLDARAAWLRARWRGRGRSLADLGRTLELEAEFRGGSWIISEPGTGSETRIRVDEGSISAASHARTRIEFDGTLDELPVELQAETASLVDLATSDAALPYEISARIPDSEIRLSGSAPLPFDREGEATFESWGPRLDALDPLFDVELPHIGPYRTRGHLEIRGTAHSLSDATLKIGETELEGRAALDTAHDPPRLDVWLHATHLQLDDFEPEEDPESVAGEAPPRKVRETLPQLLDPETLARLDATVDVEVDRVLLGAERLGHGTLRVVVEDARLLVDPLEVHVGAGDATLGALCQPEEGELLCDVDFHTPRFDYGLVARQYDPTTDARGLLTLDAALSSVSPDPDVLLAGAHGRFDLGAWPEQMRAGVIDFVSVNLLFAVLPLLGITESSVNCVVARFDLEDGVMKDETLLIDTTQVRVEGKGTIDIERQEIDLRFRPFAKRARLLSLEPPLRVRGKFSDFRTGFSPASLMNTVFNFTTSVVTAPLSWIFGSPPPADGSDVCDDPLSRD